MRRGGRCWEFRFLVFGGKGGWEGGGGGGGGVLVYGVLGWIRMYCHFNMWLWARLDFGRECDLALKMQEKTSKARKEHTRRKKPHPSRRSIHSGQERDRSDETMTTKRFIRERKREGEREKERKRGWS